MPTVQLAGNGFGGVIQGAFGNYEAASDGTFTVDTRDAPPLLARGMAYVNKATRQYTTPLGPLAASVGAIVASASLSNGTLTILAQPDSPRQVTVEVGTGTTAITGGQAVVTYAAADGTTQVDTVSLACAVSSSVTNFLSKGVVTITSAVVSGVVGGTTPWIRFSTTATISLPTDPSPVDFSVVREYDAGATAAVGTLSAVTLGSIATTAAPNGTRTFSFLYEYTSPNF